MIDMTSQAANRQRVFFVVQTIDTDKCWSELRFQSSDKSSLASFIMVIKVN